MLVLGTKPRSSVKATRAASCCCHGCCCCCCCCCLGVVKSPSRNWPWTHRDQRDSVSCILGLKSVLPDIASALNQGAVSPLQCLLTCFLRLSQFVTQAISQPESFLPLAMASWVLGGQTDTLHLYHISFLTMCILGCQGNHSNYMASLRSIKCFLLIYFFLK